MKTETAHRKFREIEKYYDRVENGLDPGYSIGITNQIGWLSRIRYIEKMRLLEDRATYIIRTYKPE